MANASPPPNTLTHAVVVGAGMGGLLTAHAVSRHVDRVTVVERDDLPSVPAPRSGTPHGRHVHVLQPGGLDAIEGLLPGFRRDLLARGAVPVALPSDVLWLSPEGWMQPHDGRGRTILSASRDLIEDATRRLVLADAAIEIRTGVEVAALAVRDGRIAGVDVRPRGAGPGEPTERIVADLVIDSSGRRSKAPEWLEALGFERPAEEVIDADLSYATRVYRRRADDLDGWGAMLLQPRPPDCRRMAVIFPIEGDRWMVTLAGANGEVPPTDEEGFAAFASGLRSPVLADAIEHLEPLTPIVAFRRTANRRRRYESCTMPAGFLVVGDAACSFNPVYGQGMSVAAITAAEIDLTLRERMARPGVRPGDLTADLQRVVARTNAGAWMVATGADLRFPGTVGRRATVADRLVNRYLDRVTRLAASDPRTNAAYVEVLTMKAPPTSLLHPRIAARVLSRPAPAPSPAMPVARRRRSPRVEPTPVAAGAR